MREDIIDLKREGPSKAQRMLDELMDYLIRCGMGRHDAQTAVNKAGSIYWQGRDDEKGGRNAAN